MKMIKKITVLLLLIALKVDAQEKPIKIVTQDIPNRLAFYAVNETEQDYDVQITIKGTNFRQSAARPRLIRVPGASKVHLKTIILLRDKRPAYTYDLTVNDSLSKRALQKQFQRIKIKPRKPVTLYITDLCASCDSLVKALNESNYLFKIHRLNENPEIKDQLKRSFSTPIDSLDKPIINMAGRLYTRIETYAQLLEELNKE